MFHISLRVLLSFEKWSVILLDVMKLRSDLCSMPGGNLLAWSLGLDAESRFHNR